MSAAGREPQAAGLARPESGTWGFAWGAGTGIVLTLVALLIVAPAEPDLAPARVDLGSWIDTNLGHSCWLFAVTLALYLMNLSRLNRLLGSDDGAGNPRLNEVVELDQLLDVWIHLFVGIGVIWTAVGMRSALQSALGDPGAALSDTAGSVLQKLVDGGILLALTTTIVGGVGSYLMRLGKTVTVGARLNGYYDANNRRELNELIAVTRRLESALRPGPAATHGARQPAAATRADLCEEATR
ncbi:MAG TPA: hypothetical protein VIS76_11460 [Pseudomonadales bacterium]